MTKLFSNHNTFVLQWHLTVRCQMRCKHCYLYDEVLYANEFKNELHFNECLKIMDDFVHMCNTLKVHPEIHFTGGDPLLREDIFDLIYEAKKRGIRVGILGNSFLLNEDTVKRLKELSIVSYQLSLDGMKEKHDYLRQKGSFDDITRAIGLLKEHQIKTMVTMTLSKFNYEDIFELMDYVGKLGVDIFTYARFCPTGEGKDKTMWMFTAEEYRDVVTRIETKIESKKVDAPDTTYGKKCYLLSSLLPYEQNRLKLPPKDGKVYFGCSLGIHGLILLANGEVHACRRFNSKVGHVKEVSKCQTVRKMFKM